MTLRCGLKWLLLVVSLGMTVGLARSVWLRSVSYDDMLREQTCLQEACSRLQKGSDILTMHVRHFVMTNGQKADLDAYFREANGDCNRENAFRHLAEVRRNRDSVRSLGEAMELSLALMNKEYHAFRLLTKDDELATAPSEIRNYRLTDEELCVTDDERRRRALEEVFGDDYDSRKTDIRQKVSNAILSVMTVDLDRRRAMRVTFVLQNVLIGVGLTVFLGLSVSLCTCWRRA